MTGDDPKPAISAEEMQQRRAHVRAAIAENRLEGITTSDPALEEICEAYIRGEIEARDLVAAYVIAQMRAMIAARGDGEFSDDEEERYAALVRQLAELDRAA
jgi:Antitoxin VbhA